MPPSSPISAMTSYGSEKRSWTGDGPRCARSISGSTGTAGRLKCEKSRCGLFVSPLYDDDAVPNVSLSEKLKSALAESRKRRQRRP